MNAWHLDPEDNRTWLYAHSAPGDRVEVSAVMIHEDVFWLPYMVVDGQKIVFDEAHRKFKAAQTMVVASYRNQVAYNAHTGRTRC